MVGQKVVAGGPGRRPGEGDGNDGLKIDGDMGLNLAEVINESGVLPIK